MSAFDFAYEQPPDIPAGMTVAEYRRAQALERQRARRRGPSPLWRTFKATAANARTLGRHVR